MAFGGDRHTKGHNKGPSTKLGVRQRALLMRACVGEAERPGTLADVRWHPLLRELAKDDKVKKTALRNALKSLAARKLVSVTYYGGGDTKVDSYRLTALGYEVALQLRAHGGKTRASATREREGARAGPAAEALRKWTVARHEASKLLLDDPTLISDLERLFGPDPELGGGSQVEEAAKRFFLLARSTFFQDYARLELVAAQDVLGAPGASGDRAVGAELVWKSERPFDPNDPVFNAELDMIRTVFEAAQDADVPEAPGDTGTDTTDD